MKKLFICALVAGSLLFASCGGSSKKAAEPEKSQAEIFAEKAVELEAKSDYDGLMLLDAEIEKYFKNLSPEEQAKFEADFETAIAKVMDMKAGQEIGNQVEGFVALDWNRTKEEWLEKYPDATFVKLERGRRWYDINNINEVL